MSTTYDLATPKFELPIGAIAEVCERYFVRELAVFGSVLRADFRPDSDLDFLVVFESQDLARISHHAGPRAAPLGAEQVLS